MKLTNGNEVVELTDEIQIRAYKSSGYTEVSELNSQPETKKATRKRKTT